MHIGGRSGSRSAPTGAVKPALHKVRAHAAEILGATLLAPVLLVAATGSTGPQAPASAAVDADVTALAAVLSPPPNTTAGPAFVAMARTPEKFRFATSAVSAPPPAAVVKAIGSMRIPAMALDAYRNAESIMARSNPGCGVSWNLLAGIGRIESAHANGGATDVRGTAVNPIYGPTLDGSLAGNEVIVQSVSAGRVTYARALGPMQFLPGTWSRYASDGNGDGIADPQNVYDASLAAARYLCSGGMNLRDQNQVVTAILRYNNSMAYTANVLGWAAAYATGVEPVNLPTIGGSTPPPISDSHLDAGNRGLGPGTVTELASATDPLAHQHSDVANQLSVPPGPTAPGENTAVTGRCAVFCLEGASTPAAPAAPAGPTNGLFAPEPVSEPAPLAPFNSFAPPPAPEPEPVLPVATGPAPGPAPGPAN